jgi:mono/diheme cytochrome c family protein
VIRRVLGVLLMALLLGGCERGMHDMYDQPKYKSLAPSPLFANGNSARTPPPGSVPATAGEAADSSGGRRGALPAARSIASPTPLDEQGRSLAQGDMGGRAASNPLPLTMALLRRGQQRYDIYCAVCHGAAGDGDGMIVRRGFPAPPSYHSERLRNAPDSHFFQVITHGYGVMYPYADRVPVRDRWAIVAYIRALQLSRHAPVYQLDASDRAQLQASAGANR